MKTTCVWGPRLDPFFQYVGWGMVSSCKSALRYRFHIALGIVFVNPRFSAARATQDLEMLLWGRGGAPTCIDFHYCCTILASYGISSPVLVPDTRHH